MLVAGEVLNEGLGTWRRAAAAAVALVAEAAAAAAVALAGARTRGEREAGFVGCGFTVTTHGQVTP